MNPRGESRGEVRRVKRRGDVQQLARPRSLSELIDALDANRAIDWTAALGEDARRLQPRLTHATQTRGDSSGGVRFLTVLVRADRLTAAERAWIDAVVARREGLTAWNLPLEELALSFHTQVAALDEDFALARILRHISCHVARPRERPLLMGVVNVTPDSFSDGGHFVLPERAIERGLALVADGADLLDVGGESTRPGSEGVSVELELARVAPVIEGLRRRSNVVLSVDTQKAVVAQRALELGATVVNDVSAGRFDPAMLPLIAQRGASFILMHMLGTPRDMQHEPRYARDVVAEVLEFLRERAAACAAAGIAPERLIVDPGIGFGKRLEHNLALIARVGELRSLGLPVAVGPSRKSFIAALEARVDPEVRESSVDGRLGGTAAAIALAVRGGAQVLRVHDVGIMRQAARVAFAASDASLDFPIA